MSRIRSLLATTYAMVAMAESMNNDLVYADEKPKPYKKSNLTNKQLKARNKSKASRKARKMQRS